MRKPVAATISALFFAAAPGVVAGVVPWQLTDWQASTPPPALPLRVLGGLLVIAGATVLIQAFARFVREGLGTPLPLAPTEHLVVGGLYRYVRNPMYLAVLTTVLGQALLLGRTVLVVYAAIVAAFFVAFVLLYEEPTLARRYGESYERYRKAVPGWWPRLRPWQPPQRLDR